MDTRKMNILNSPDGNSNKCLLSLSETAQGGDVIAHCDMVHTEPLREVVRRVNAYPELLDRLHDMAETAKEVENMMDGDRDKQEAWAEELGRLYVAIDEARAVLSQHL